MAKFFSQVEEITFGGRRFAIARALGIEFLQQQRSRFKSRIGGQKTLTDRLGVIVKTMFKIELCFIKFCAEINRTRHGLGHRDFRPLILSDRFDFFAGQQGFSGFIFCTAGAFIFRIEQKPIEI